MADFVDKKGRTIRIDLNGDDAVAYHESKKIGEVTTTGEREFDERMPPWPPKITGWELEAQYRRAGICTDMVRQLFEQFGILEPPEKNLGIGNQNALTNDGMEITRHCQKLGYVAELEEELPPRGYDDDEDE